MCTYFQFTLLCPLLTSLINPSSFNIVLEFRLTVFITTLIASLPDLTQKANFAISDLNVLIHAMVCSPLESCENNVGLENTVRLH